MVKLINACLAALITTGVCGQAPLQIQRIDVPLQIDGKLDEAEWQMAIPHHGFIQCLPSIGNTPTERTAVRFLYNNDFLYIGIDAYDSVPSRLIATGLERDVYYSSDDHVCIMLDTYHDQRQGILFSTNGLSARFDEEVLDNGNNFNAAFNTFWNVRTERNSEGYTVEFEIPFSALRFRNAEQVIMGVKVIRYIKHRNEYDVFPASDATVGNAVWRINNSQPIAFANLKARKPFFITPYAKASYQESTTWNSSSHAREVNAELLPRHHFVDRSAVDRAVSNFGIDAKYGISKNFTLDATLNTDFAQAETDNRILNFTRFAVNLPEKRNFFLESKDYLGYSTGSGMLLFNSRTIGLERGHVVPVIGGVRLSGKTNGLQVGLLDLQTGGVVAHQIDPQHISVLRARKEVWGNGSFVGGIFTNRVSTKGDRVNNQVVALDAVKRFKDNKWIAALNTGATHQQGRALRESTMANVMVNRVSTLGYNHSSSLEYAGKYFRPQVGFAPDSAYVLVNTVNSYVWKSAAAKRNLQWVTQTLNYKYRTINNTHESLYTELEFGYSAKDGSSMIVAPNSGREYLPYDWNFRNDILIPIGYYTTYGVRARYDSRQTKPLNYSITSQMSGFYGGVRVNGAAIGYYAINRNFRVTYNYEFNTFRFPASYSPSDHHELSSHLVRAGIAYTRSIYFSAKALLQYDDVSKTISGNFRVRVNPKEGTDLYIVYNPRLNTAFYTERRETAIDQQSVIIKFSKAITW